MDVSTAPSTSTTKPLRRSRILAALDAELPNWLAGPLIPDAVNLVVTPVSSRWVSPNAPQLGGSHPYRIAYINLLQWDSLCLSRT